MNRDFNPRKARDLLSEAGDDDLPPDPGLAGGPAEEEEEDDDDEGQLSTSSLLAAKNFLQNDFGSSLAIGQERLEEFEEHRQVSEFGYSSRAGGLVRLASGDSFLEKANRKHLTSKYSFLNSSAALDQRDYADMDDFYNTLTEIDDDLWDSFIGELNDLENYPVLDEELMSELETEAFDAWMESDGVDEFIEACTGLEPFQNSFAQFVLGSVTLSQVYNIYGESNETYEAHDDYVSLDMNRVVRDLDVLDHLTHWGDREPELRQRYLRAQLRGFENTLLPVLDREIRRLWSDDPEVARMYTKFDSGGLFRLLLTCTPDDKWGSGDPAWYPEFYDANDSWVVGLEIGGNRRDAAEGVTEAMTLVAGQFPGLVHRMQLNDPRQLALNLESQLIEADLNALGWFKYGGVEEVYRNAHMILMKVNDPDMIRLYVRDADKFGQYDDDQTDYIVLVSDKTDASNYWISTSAGGDVTVQAGPLRDYGGVLEAPEIRDGLLAYFEGLVSGGDPEKRAPGVLFRILIQLGGVEAVLRLIREHPGLAAGDSQFQIGIEAGKNGHIAAARRFLQDDWNKVVEEGVWVVFGNWSNTVCLFDDKDRKMAERLFDGEGRYWFEGSYDPEFTECVEACGDAAGPGEIGRLRDLMRNLRYVDADGELVRLTRPDLDGMDDAELLDFLAEHSRDPDFKEILRSFQLAIMDAHAEASEGAMMRYFEKAAVDDTGATRSEWIGGRLAFLYSWKTLESILADYGNEESAPWQGSAGELVRGYAPRASVGRDDFWTSPKREDIRHALEYQLDELSETPEPQDPNQLNLPMENLAARETALRLLEEKHDYSCLMLELPREQAGFVQDWARANILDENVYIDPKDGGKGREDKPHVTVKWGIQIDRPNGVLTDLVARTRAFPVKLWRVGIFRGDDCDVVMLQVASPWLRALNARVKAVVPNVDTHPDYKPHCTLAYVKKGTADALEGMEIFGAEGAPDSVFYVYELVFTGFGGDDGDPANRKRLPLLRDNGRGPAEATVTEAAPDPFGKLPFPSDADRLPFRPGRPRRRRAAGKEPAKRALIA